MEKIKKRKPPTFFPSEANMGRLGHIKKKKKKGSSSLRNRVLQIVCLCQMWEVYQEIFHKRSISCGNPKAFINQSDWTLVLEFMFPQALYTPHWNTFPLNCSHLSASTASQQDNTVDRDVSVKPPGWTTFFGERKEWNLSRLKKETLRPCWRTPILFLRPYVIISILVFNGSNWWNFHLLQNLKVKRANILKAMNGAPLILWWKFFVGHLPRRCWQAPKRLPITKSWPKLLMGRNYPTCPPAPEKKTPATFPVNKTKRKEALFFGVLNSSPSMPNSPTSTWRPDSRVGPPTPWEWKFCFDARVHYTMELKTWQKQSCKTWRCLFCREKAWTNVELFHVQNFGCKWKRLGF